jgi:hypothetical protein
MARLRIARPFGRMNSSAIRRCAFLPLREAIFCFAFVSCSFVDFQSSVLAQLPVFGPTVRDPAKIVGSDQCAKCHDKEVQQWRLTSHFTTFDSLHRTPAAKDIADRLGLASIKRNDTCLQCHYTQQEQAGRLRIIEGVSCESCHGGAADWIAFHADYGGENVTKAMETPAHREQRMKESIARGMNNPHNVYLVAKQCYSCHTVPNERLVNVGGHSAGSPGFELVSWSQGVVRHNFLRTASAANGENSPAQLRVLYVVGVLADLEYSLRATAAATEKATFGAASAQRAARMKQRLHEIQRLVNEPLLNPALEAVASVELRLGNSEAVLAAAGDLSKAAYMFAEQADGNRLAAIDPLLPRPEQYKSGR